MSTSSTAAKRDLMRQLTKQQPKKPVELDVYTWGRIFEYVAADMPLRSALEFQTFHSEAYRSVELAFRAVTQLKIELYEGKTCEGDPEPVPVYVVQGSSTRCKEKALQMVAFALGRARRISTLDIYFEDLDISLLNDMLDEVLKSDNVQLEVLNVKRRYAGQCISKVSELVQKHSKTMKKVGRLGLAEAIVAFSDELRLDSLGLMTFDLGFDPLPHEIPEQINKLTVSGARFKHLSYTSFVGFDVTQEDIQDFLDKCQVETMKLTMMRGPKISARPAYMVGKVRGVKMVDLVELVDQPSRVTKLAAYRQIFEKVFPHAVDCISVRQQWQ